MAIKREREWAIDKGNCEGTVACICCDVKWSSKFVCCSCRLLLVVAGRDANKMHLQVRNCDQQWREGEREKESVSKWYPVPWAIG